MITAGGGSPEPRSRESIFVGALLVTAVAAVFLPALDLFLIGDDFEWLDAAYEIPRRPAASFELINMMWRPVVKWAFLFDYLAFGQQSIGYAVTNLAIHVLNVWLLWVLLCRLQKRRFVAAAAAAGFALSPLHSEAVLWASSRGDTLLLTTWLGSLLVLIAWPRDAKRSSAAAVLILGLIAAGAKESWVVFPFIGTLFLVVVLREPLHAAVKRMRWLWLMLLLYLGVFMVLPAISGMTTPAYYADFSPLPALFNLSRLVISFCGLGGLALNDAAVVGLAAAITAAVVIATFRQGNRRALWTISWLAATLALAAPFQDPSLRHNYLPLAGFWMTIAFLVAGAMETGAAEGRQQHRRIQSIVLSVAAIVVLVIEGSALQLEISDYRRHGDLHRELAEMLEVVEPHIPRHRPLLFVDRGRRRAVNETVHSVTGVEKSFFVREDAIWQLVFLPSLLNFLGDPFEAKLTPVAKDRVATVLGAEVTVLVFTDGGFYLADRLPDSVSRAVAATGRLPATVTLYDFQPN